MARRAKQEAATDDQDDSAASAASPASAPSSADLMRRLTSDPPLTPTALALLAAHGGPVVPLEEICHRYFGLAYREACRAATLGRLPVPAFRMIESRKAPMMVHVADLAAFVDRSGDAARDEWQKAQG